MIKEQIVMIYCPCESAAEASALGHRLLKKKLAACINILPEIKSAYWWEGAIQEDKEAVLLVKTNGDCLEPAAKEIKNHHSYTVPAILSWQVGSENSAFTSFLRKTLCHD